MVIASVRFLATGNYRHDRTALAAGELIVLFDLSHSSPGPVGTPFVGHILGLGRADDSKSGQLDDRVRLSNLETVCGPGSEKLGAGFALFGMANVPFIYISVNYWRTIHPPTSVVPTLPFSLGLPLWFCVIAFLLLFVVLLKLRIRVEEQQARVDALYLALDDAIVMKTLKRWCAVVLLLVSWGIIAGAQQPKQQEQFCPWTSCRRPSRCRPRRCSSRLCLRDDCPVRVCSVARRLSTVQQELKRLDASIKQRRT